MIVECHRSGDDIDPAESVEIRIDSSKTVTTREGVAVYHTDTTKEHIDEEGVDLRREAVEALFRGEIDDAAGLDIGDFSCRRVGKHLEYSDDSDGDFITTVSVDGERSVGMTVFVKPEAVEEDDDVVRDYTQG